MEKLLEYRDIINQKLDLILETQADTLNKIKDIIVKAVADDHILHMFGTGHSHAMAEEFFFRAGGFACVNAILEGSLMVHESAVTATAMERIKGYANIILDKYTTVLGDVMVIFSNSGINAVPVEMAVCAKEKGLTVIALTSVQSSAAEHARGKPERRLYEVADYYIDTMIDPGDASVALPNGLRCGPISTVICDTLLHGIFVQAADELCRMGKTAPILVSANTNGGDEKNRVLLDRYRGRIKHF